MRPVSMCFYINFEEFPEWEMVKKLEVDRYHQWFKVVSRRMSEDIPNSMEDHEQETGWFLPGIAHTVKLLDDKIDLNQYAVIYEKFINSVMRDSYLEVKNMPHTYSAHVVDPDGTSAQKAKDFGFKAFNYGEFTAIEIEAQDKSKAKKIAKQFGRVINVYA